MNPYTEPRAAPAPAELRSPHGAKPWADARDATQDWLPPWLRLGLLFAAIGLLLRATAHLRAADLDMFHEMALVREFLRSGSFPRVDVFAYTPTVERVVHHEWGTGGVLYLVAVASGWGAAGIIVLWYLLFGATVVATYVAARQRGATLPVVVLLAGAAGNLFAPGLAPVRAQMFTFLFTALLLVLFEQDKRGRRGWIAIWLPVYVLWLNLHGGFVVGAGLFGLYVLERLLGTGRAAGLRTAVRSHRHLLATGLAMMPLTLANPYGWYYLPYLWHALRLERPLIDEWAPLWSSAANPLLQLVFGVSLALVVYAVARGPRPLRLPELSLLLAAAAHALQHQRGLPIYAVVWFVCAGGYLAGTPLATLLDRWVRGWPRFVALLAVGIGGFGVWRAASSPWDHFVPALPTATYVGFPVGAVDYLADVGFTGKLLTSFDEGAYVSWKLHPAVRVSLDSRYEVAYPPGLLELHEAFFTDAGGGDELLARYPADAVLVQRTAPVASRLARAAGDGWIERYRDHAFLVYVRAERARDFPARDRSGHERPGRLP